MEHALPHNNYSNQINNWYLIIKKKDIYLSLTLLQPNDAYRIYDCSHENS